MRMMGGFRGFTAPASLKHGHSPRRVNWSPVFPGLYRPGLIEANTIHWIGRLGRLVSGALPPRPH